MKNESDDIDDDWDLDHSTVFASFQLYMKFNDVAWNFGLIL